MDQPSSRDLPASPRDFPEFCLGDVVVRPSLHELQHQDSVVGVHPRAMHLLVCLAARDGGLVTRQELLDTVWTEAVVGEEAITRVVSDLRSALADDSRRPRYIATIRKGGYRLLMTPRYVRDETARGDVPVVDAPSVREGGRGRRRAPRRVLPLVMALAVVLIGAVGWLSRGRSGDGREVAAMTPVRERPLTVMPGLDLDPALGPRGDRVAFAHRDLTAGDVEIYVQPVHGDQHARRLTSLGGRNTRPVWSPDGQTIIFLHEGARPGFYEVAAGGGQPRLVLAHDRACYGLAWSPDGTRLVFATPPPGAVAGQLVALDLTTRTTSNLTDGVGFCDVRPCYDPTGDRLAFGRADDTGCENLWIMDLADGRGEAITRHLRTITGLAWSPDGRSVYVGDLDGGRHRLWRCDLASGEARQVFLPGGPAGAPSAALAGHELVVTRSQVTSDILVVHDDESGSGTAACEPLVVSSHRDASPSLSPDGQRVAFLSNRSGDWNVWVTDVDAGEPRRLTGLSGIHASAPHWSADGSEVIYETVDAEGPVTWAVPADGGTSRRLSLPDRTFYLGGVVGDRRLLGEVSGSRGWRRAWLDERQAVHLLDLPRGSRVVGCSPDGHLDLVLPGGGLWRRTLDDGALRNLVPADSARGLRAWAPWRHGVYAIRRDDGAWLVHRDLDSGTERRVASVDGLSVAAARAAANGRLVLLEVVTHMRQNLVLVEGVF